MTATRPLVTADDPDIAFIKAITGSQDLTEFADIHAHAHLLDVSNGNWNMLHGISDVDIFKDYCTYLWEEAYKLISKQKKNMLAIEKSFPSILSTNVGQELFGKRLSLYMNIPRNKVDHIKIKSFNNDHNEYTSAQLEFKDMIRENTASPEWVNIDVLVTEGYIFSEAWLHFAGILEKKRLLKNLSDPNATGEVLSYHLAISYIYHILHPMLENLSGVVKPNDLYVMIKIYWLTAMAKQNQESRKKINKPERKNNDENDKKQQKLELTESSTSILSFDDYIIRNLLPDNARGITVKSEKSFWRDVVTKAWFYNESLKGNNRKQNLEIEIGHTLQPYYGMEEETARKYVRNILKPGRLFNTLPDELKKVLGLVE